MMWIMYNWLNQDVIILRGVNLLGFWRMGMSPSLRYALDCIGLTSLSTEHVVFVRESYPLRYLRV